MRIKNLKEKAITRRLACLRLAEDVDVSQTIGKAMNTSSMQPTPKATKLKPVASILSACLIPRLN